MSDPKGANSDPSMDDIMASIRKIISEDEALSQAGGEASAAPEAKRSEDVLLLTDLVQEPPEQPATPPPPALKAVNPSKPAPPAAPATPVPPPMVAQVKKPEPAPVPVPAAARVTPKNDLPPAAVVPPPQPVVESPPPPKAAAAAPPPPLTPTPKPTPAPAPVAAEPVKAMEAPVKQPISDNADPLVNSGAAGVAASAFDRLSKAVQDNVPAPAAQETGPAVSSRNLEEIVKDMLRPMLKEWLEKNLPPLVERYVEREIVRLTRR